MTCRNRAGLGQALAAVWDGGTVVTVRGYRGDGTDRVRVAPIFVCDYAKAAAELDRLAELAGDGRLTVRVAGRLPASRAADAHRSLEQRGIRGRFVLQFDWPILKQPIRSERRTILGMARPGRGPSLGAHGPVPGERHDGLEHAVDGRHGLGVEHDGAPAPDDARHESGQIRRCRPTRTTPGSSRPPAVPQDGRDLRTGDEHACRPGHSHGSTPAPPPSTWEP
ncbi:zinc-binding dehydrogenase [Streptosporangium sandarakinum]|uniref:zinc-binding dehydrogenase n=1 Tax=Streptosporangium sandarakinum TaxID=1260955 RepID=UPI0028A88A0D|nr:zinc-binding dehydrogenase [Streptosporangium sandarakinum]